MNAALHRSWSADLDTATLYALLALRVEVFVVEQECPYRELDGTDLQPDTRHFWLMQAALAEVKSAPCRVNAQSHLTGLYAEHRFTPDGAEFVDDGISHTLML